MKTRTQQTRPLQETSFQEQEDQLDLDALTEDELEALLFEEQEESSKGMFNLPTIAGLSMIVVGIAYLFQKLGVLGGFDLGALATMLPWLAGILIILLGFGVLSWRPKKKKQQKAAQKMEAARKATVDAKKKGGAKKRLHKSRDKKIAGVCGGLAEYFNIDPTLVRIAFVIATIATNGAALIAYFVLAAVMSKPEPASLSKDERITIIRDS